MNVVKVAIMNIVDVIVVLDCSVSAVGTMFVIMAIMCFARHICNSSDIVTSF